MTTITPPAALSPSPRWFPDAAGFRGVLITLTCAVSLAYAATSKPDALPLHPGMAVGVAALAWCVLFGLTWTLSPAAHRVARFDGCLWTAAVGSVFMLGWLALGQTASALGMPPAIADTAPLAGLGTANLAMTWVFTRAAPALAVRRRDALLIWVVGMNGLLATGLLLGSLVTGATP